MVAQPAVLMWSRTRANVKSSPDFLQTNASVVEGYTVITDVGDTVVDALGAADLPTRGVSVYPGTILLCTTRRPRQLSPIFWLIEVEYEGQLGPSGENDSPINQPPVIVWQSVTSTEAIDEGYNENDEKVPISTVLGEPIDGVTKPVSDFRLVVERNYLGINMPATAQYLDSVNSDSWPPSNAFAPGTGHLEAFDATEQIDQGLSQGYFRVRAQILFRVPYLTTPERAWWARVRHEGYRFKAADNSIKNAIEDNQDFVTRPILLDADGKKLPPGPDGNVDPATVVWLEFRRFQYELPYAALGLI